MEPKTHSTKRTANGFDPSRILKIVRDRRCLLIRLDHSDFYSFLERADLGRHFTMAVQPGTVHDTRTPTLALVFGDDISLSSDDSATNGSAHIGVFSRKRPLTALEHGIKITHLTPIDPAALAEIAELVVSTRAKRALARRLAVEEKVLSLPPDLSAQIIKALASRSSNRAAFERISGSLDPPRAKAKPRLLQADAIKSALEIFGLPKDAQAAKLKLPEQDQTELSQFWLREDAVIEHDARSVPELQLTQSHVTGRALFRRNNEILEVITANRRPLERVLGVDLIYHNVLRESLVMVQYKMLDPNPKRAPNSQPDWTYHPDKYLKREIERMNLIAERISQVPTEYRLNPEMFYLKFVKRDMIGSSAAITLPLKHFQTIPLIKGSRGGRRISYQALNGSYLRDDAFFGLIRAGYIGAHSATTKVLLPIIDALVAGNRAVVVAIQSALTRP